MATPDIYAEVKEWGLAIRAHVRIATEKGYLRRRCDLAIRAHVRIATNKLMNHYSMEERLAIRAPARVAPPLPSHEFVV